MITVAYTELEREKFRRIQAELRLLEAQYRELLQERDALMEEIKQRAEVPEGKKVDWAQAQWTADALIVPDSALVDSPSA